MKLGQESFWEKLGFYPKGIGRFFSLLKRKKFGSSINLVNISPGSNSGRIRRRYGRQM